MMRWRCYVGTYTISLHQLGARQQRQFFSQLDGANIEGVMNITGIWPRDVVKRGHDTTSTGRYRRFTPRYAGLLFLQWPAI